MASPTGAAYYRTYATPLHMWHMISERLRGPAGRTLLARAPAGIYLFLKGILCGPAMTMTRSNSCFFFFFLVFSFFFFFSCQLYGACVRTGVSGVWGHVTDRSRGACDQSKLEPHTWNKFLDPSFASLAAISKKLVSQWAKNQNNFRRIRKSVGVSASHDIGGGRHGSPGPRTRFGARILLEYSSKTGGVSTKTSSEAA